MNTTIHPYLLARLIAVQQAFNRPVGRPSMSAAARVPIAAKKGNNWQDILKEEDEDGEQGGGRGTMRGHRGKNAEHAKAAMRRLTRK
ncbi:MAG TPA: hypothetical protein VLG38_06685 [Gammaproteobacteria bacterium]|nr:hypothetical protein [Gammaproteobacteria bacterium]